MVLPEQSTLPKSVLSNLSRMLSARLLPQEPSTITFATSSFEPILLNWLSHAAKAGVSAPIVVAMDGWLADRLKYAGIPCITHSYDGTLGDLWRQRILFFEFLASEGVDFIHSDIDAVWLKDPRPACFADSSLDLVFSQGTTYPEQIWREWKFVLCCGLFAAKSRPSVARFFAAARKLVEQVSDDQVAINLLLAHGRLDWRAGGRDSYELAINGRTFTCFRHLLHGVSEALDLHVGMLPHQFFPRLPTTGAGAFVKHPLGPGNPQDKAFLLKQVGCWKNMAN